VTVRIRLFAVARQLAGTELVALDVPDECTIGDVRRLLAAKIPSLGPVLPHVLFAIGSDYVNDDTLVSPDAEVACIPPVSGG
jgi:molybdopterin converting factor small subunit